MNTAQFPEIAKAVGAQRGGKYLKRTPLPGGGYRYTYKPSKAPELMAYLATEAKGKNVAEMEKEQLQLQQLIETGNRKVERMEKETEHFNKKIRNWAMREVKLMDQIMAAKNKLSEPRS